MYILFVQPNIPYKRQYEIARPAGIFNTLEDVQKKEIEIDMQINNIDFKIVEVK